VRNKDDTFNFTSDLGGRRENVSLLRGGERDGNREREREQVNGRESVSESTRERWNAYALVSVRS
jgi:hypothetical protein